MNITNPFNPNNNLFQQPNSTLPTFTPFGNTSQNPNLGLLANATTAAAKTQIPPFNFVGNSTIAQPIFGSTSTTSTPQLSSSPFSLTNKQQTTMAPNPVPFSIGWNTPQQSFTQPPQQHLQQPTFSFLNQQTPAAAPNIFQLQPQQNQVPPQAAPIQLPQPQIDPNMYKTLLEYQRNSLLVNLRNCENEWQKVSLWCAGNCGTFMTNPGLLWNPQQQINYILPNSSCDFPCPYSQAQQIAPPYMQYPVCRPSTLALDYLHGLGKGLRDNPDIDARSLWSYRDNKYPLKSLSLVNSSPCLPTRSYGSTCLADQYRDYHFNSTPSKSTLPATPLFDDKNYLKQRTQSWKKGHEGYTYGDWEHSPQSNRFRVGGTADFYLNRLRYHCNNCPTSKCEVDRKSKMYTIQIGDDGWGRSGRGGLTLDKKYDVLSNKPVSRILARGDTRHQKGDKMWNWLQIGRSTGPPLKSHLDDCDLELYEIFKTNEGRQAPASKVANLPGRVIVGYKRSQPLLRSILKSSSVNARAKTKVTKEDLQALYARWQGEGGNEDAPESSETTGTRAYLEEKTSPVFFSNWKTRKPARVGAPGQVPTGSASKISIAIASSSGTQTDNPLDEDDYFIAKFQSDCQKKAELGKEFSKTFIPMDPYRGRFLATGTRIGQHELQRSSSCDIELLYDCKSSKTRNHLHGENFDSSSSLDQNYGPSGVKLTRTMEGYYCIPDVVTLDKSTMKHWDCLHVKDFEVGHRKHGKVVFSGYTNVFGLNLDEIILFCHKSVIIYPDQDQMPAFGKGLHKPGIVTLYNVWPKEKVEVGHHDGGDLATPTTTCPKIIRDPKRVAELGFEGMLRKSCERFKGTFISYCPLRGKWTFRVQECISSPAGDQGNVNPAAVDSEQEDLCI